MMQLTGYIRPQAGAEYTTSLVWVNPRLIAHMSTYEAYSARSVSGTWDSPKIPVTSICFAAALANEQIGVSVVETPEQILKALHYWEIDNTPGYKELHA